MTNKDIFVDSFPQDKQIGDPITRNLKFNLMNLFQRMIYPSSKAT